MSRPSVFDRLAEQVRTDIMTMQHGVMIPSIRALAQRYRVARNTIQKALTILVEQGAIGRDALGRRYTRRRDPGGRNWCKPYPGVGVLSSVRVDLSDANYLSVLVSRFIVDLNNRGLPVGFIEMPQIVSTSILPGGVALGPAKWRCSGTAFCHGVPEPLQKELAQAGAVVMMLDEVSPVEGVDCVGVDVEAEADTVIDYLCGLGHQTIALMVWRYPGGRLKRSFLDPDCERLSRAMLRAKERHRAIASPLYHTECVQEKLDCPAPVQAAVARLWRLNPRPTAIVCFEEGLARLACAALQERGLSCPGHVSIVARGVLSQQAPRFTLLAAEPSRMGVLAAEHMARRMSDPTITPAHLLFQSKLVPGPTTSRIVRQPA